MAVQQRASGVDEVHVLWISEGMSCDGDSVSITAAAQPSIEDVLLGAIPGLPKVHLHNKVLSPTLGGEEFLEPFRQAARGELDAPFVLVIEGSIPNEKINGEGYWTSFGNDEVTGEPLTLNWWLDRARAEGVGRGCDRHLRGLRRDPRDGRQPDRRHGAGRLPGVGVPLGRRAADRQRPRLPGAAGELHGGAHLAALPGRRAGADDPAR